MAELKRRKKLSFYGMPFPVIPSQKKTSDLFFETMGFWPGDTSNCCRLVLYQNTGDQLALYILSAESTDSLSLLAPRASLGQEMEGTFLETPVASGEKTWKY